jgi:myosin heavy chain (fragment)
MKWKFSKVTALLLAGAMMVTSGCTDYKDDIQDLNKRLDDLNAETVANFETQKNAMETLQKELEKADDDIQKNIDAIESDIKKLQDADATLKKAMEDADAALKKELEAADAALKKAMEDADSKLQQAIESGDAATLAAAKADAKANLDAAKQDLENQIKGVQSNLDSEIKKINEIIDTLATKEELATAKSELQEELKAAVAVLNQRIDKEVATLNATIETAVEELKAMIAALDAKKLDKQEFEDYKTEVARHFAAIENSIAALDTRLTAQIANLEADLNGKISALENRMASAEAAIKRIEGETIPAIADQIAALDEQVRQNANDLAAYKALTDKSVALLQIAVNDLANGLATLDSKVDSLGDKLEQYYSDIQAALNDRVLTAVFEQYKQEVAWKLEDMKADYEGQIAETKAALEQKIAACEQMALELNAAMLRNLNGQVANLKQAIAESEARSKQEIAAVKSELEQKLTALENRVSAIEEEIAKMQSAISELEKDLQKAVEEIKHITEEGGVLATAIDGVIKKHDMEVAAINERINALSGRVDQLEIDVDDLLSRIQSIVYVPDYNDGKITIEYAVLNGKVVEGQSKITYKVLPASETNTTLLAQAWRTDNSILDFASKEVAIRAAGNEMFQIKDVEANGDLLTLTVATRGLGDEFYAEKPTKSYSIALLVNYENNIRSTEYANCIAGEPKELDLYILKEDKTDITDTEKVANYKIQYIDLGVEYGHNVLAGHYPAFSIGGGADRFTLAEMTAKGYAIDLVSEIAYDVEGENVFVNAPKEDGEVEFGTIANVSLGEEKAAAVGAVETVMYNYTACGKTVYTTATVTVTKITSKVEFAPAEIKWNYLLDAASDASEDVDTARENYVIAIANSTLPSETDWAGVLAGELTELTVNGSVVTAPVVGFDKDAEGAPVVNLTKFEWNKEYKIVAEYALSNVDVTVSLTVNTFDRAREAITIDLGTKDWNFVRDLEIAAGEIEDNLSVVYDAINGPREGQDFAALDGIETDKFLTDIFANEEHALTDVKNIVGDKDMKEEWISKLTIADDGQTVSAVYTYKSDIAFDENGDLKYTKTFTTWYGQEVTLVKTIHFVLPKYDYQDSEYFVMMLDGLYFSSVNPKYADSENNALTDKMSSQVYYYDVWNVDMNQAFNVIDLDKNSEILEADAEKAAGLVRVFEIETPEADRPGITMNDNEIYYGGAADYVDVLGRLYIENSNGSRVELPTSFANTYANYQVQKYVPLESMGNKPLECTVDNANTYTINVLEGVVLKDKRGFDLIADGAFVVGNGVDNGFADEKNVKDVYGLEIVYTDDMATLTPNIKPFISWDAENTSVVFNYNGQMDLKKPVEVTVRIAIKYTWGDDYTDVKCVFKKAE